MAHGLFVYMYMLSLLLTPAAAVDVYAELGVDTLINAAGTITTIGGSLMPQEVQDAWRAASEHFVDMYELQDAVGDKVAQMLNVTSAMVTTGAAGAIMLGTAAALTVDNPERVGQLPLDPSLGIEVIRQKSNSDCYDRQVALRVTDHEMRVTVAR